MLFPFILSTWMMDAHSSHHFTIYPSQTIILYALNVYGDAYQLYPNKLEKCLKISL